MNGQYQQPPAPMPGNSMKAGGINRHTKGPPELPPRGIARGNSIGSGPPSRDTSLNRRIPPDVPPKRSSLTRSDLALFSDMVSILILYEIYAPEMPYGVIAINDNFPFLFPVSRAEPTLCREESVV